MAAFTYRAGSDGSGGFVPPNDPRQLHVNPLGALGLVEFGGVRVHGAPSNSGVPVDVQPGTFTLAGLGGLIDTPEVRTTLTDRAEQHGAFMAGSFYASRIITVEGFILTDFLEQLWPALDRLKGAFRVTRDFERMDFLLPGWSERRFVLCRTSAPLTVAAPGGGSESRKPYRDFQAVVTAPDPRLYGATLLNTAGVDFGASLSSVGNTSTQVQPNAGNFDAPIEWVVVGPAESPELVDDARSRAIRYSGPVPTGQTLRVLSGERTALLNGVNVFQNLTRFDDLAVPPGGATYRGVSQATNPGGTWRVEHRDVWV